MNKNKIVENTEVENTIISRHTEVNYYEPTVVIKKESKINKILLSPISVAVIVFGICLSFSYKILKSNLEDKNNQVFNTQFTQINSEIKKYEKHVS